MLGIIPEPLSAILGNILQVLEICKRDNSQFALARFCPERVSRFCAFTISYRTKEKHNGRGMCRRGFREDVTVKRDESYQ